MPIFKLKNKIKLEKIIYEEIKEHEISEESLRTEYKDAKESNYIKLFYICLF